MSTRVLSASAGTGKTYRLTEELWSALHDRQLRPEGIVAITYTKRAASELESRIRQRLLKAGETGFAARIRDGYIGTIHSVCQRLLREYALEGGHSPYLEPLPARYEDALFARAIGGVIAGRERELAALATRLAIEDWRPALKSLVRRARENRMDAAAVADSARASAASLSAVLGPATMSAAEYRTRFVAELQQVEPQLAAKVTTVQATRDRARLAARALEATRDGGLPTWNDQQSLANGLKKVVSLRPIVGGLLDLIDAHTRTEGFQRDLAQMQTALFDLARAALVAFANEKATARLVDFGDMLALASDLVREPPVAEALRSKLDLVLVDEFQDTSPLQLELVMRLAGLARESVWVGDRKQSIFAFQGAAPELMSAAMHHASGGRELEVLEHNRRSRPALVAFHSDVFCQVLAGSGFEEREVRSQAAYPDPANLASQHVLELWTWSTDKQTLGDRKVTPSQAEAIAAGVVELLAAAPLVRERGRPEAPARPARRSDVAVVARTNAHCLALGAALARRGLPVRLALDGLSRSPEGVLARAVVELLADRRDSVAAALLSYLGEEAARDPEQWLARRLDEVRRCEAERDAGRDAEYPAAFADDWRVARVRELHDRVADLSPAEAFALVVREARLAELVRTWPRPEQRLANLEVLRARAQEYEELCRVQRRPATVLGLAAYLRDDLEGESDQQAMPSTVDAVTVITYWKAKGLEWPVVVLADLDADRERGVFDPEVVPAATFDPAQPLGGRWVRYWPWPYGGKSKGLRLADDARASAHGVRVAKQDREERVRLLYVAFTRARDALVLAAGVGGETTGPEVAALDVLVDSDGQAVLGLPFDAPGELGVATVAGGRSVACRVRRLSGVAAASEGAGEAERPWYAGGEPLARPAEVVNPSHERETTGGPGSIAAVARLGAGARPKVRADAMADVGNAIHAFLAADTGVGDRGTMADRLLRAHGVAGAVSPSTLIGAADALRASLEARFPGAVWRREWPVRARLQAGGHERLLRGEIDLLLELDRGFVLVDHKSFAGHDAGLDEQVPKYASQLRWYAAAARAALGKPLLAALVHLPLRGELVELDLGAA